MTKGLEFLFRVWYLYLCDNSHIFLVSVASAEEVSVDLVSPWVSSWRAAGGSGDSLRGPGGRRVVTDSCVNCRPRTYLLDVPVSSYLCHPYRGRGGGDGWGGYGRPRRRKVGEAEGETNKKGGGHTQGGRSTEDCAHPGHCSWVPPTGRCHTLWILTRESDIDFRPNTHVGVDFGRGTPHRSVGSPMCVCGPGPSDPYRTSGRCVVSLRVTNLYLHSRRPYCPPRRWTCRVSTRPRRRQSIGCHRGDELTLKTFRSLTKQTED